MKAVGRVILSAILLVLTGLAAAFARFLPESVFRFYPDWSRTAIRAIASVTGKLPFSLWEVLVVLAALWFLYSLIRVLRQKKSFLRWLSGVLLFFSAALAIFVGLWGLGHFGPSVSERMALPVRKYTKEELFSATSYYADQLTSLSDSVSRDSRGLTYFADFKTLSARAASGYAALGTQYDLFAGELSPVKKILSWPLFSRFGTTGIFVCFTGESCVNPDTYEVWIPFTMCHELAHQLTVTAEDDANFCAYLACMENENVQFRYSGAFAAYIYCHNALTKIDPTAAADLWWTLPDGVRADAAAANAHYAQYEGKVQQAAQKVNDAYLKAFDEPSGVQSYGEVTDLLIAWYLQKK